MYRFYSAYNTGSAFYCPNFFYWVVMIFVAQKRMKENDFVKFRQTLYILKFQKRKKLYYFFFVLW